MQIVFRSGELEHRFESDSAGGRILAAIAKGLPGEVAAIAHNGTPRHPELTTQAELLSAIGAVLKQIDSAPALLFGYAVSVEAHGDEPPGATSMSRGNGISGIRLPGAAPDRAFAIWCGPGQCDLVEMRIEPDGRGTELGTVDLRGEREVLTANMGRIRVHRKKVKTQLPQELKRLQAAVQSWPGGEIAKFMRQPE
jgi:hypothetical protein